MSSQASVFKNRVSASLLEMRAGHTCHKLKVGGQTHAVETKHAFRLERRRRPRGSRSLLPALALLKGGSARDREELETRVPGEPLSFASSEAVKEEGLAPRCANSRYGFNNPESLWGPALSGILSRGMRIRAGEGTAEAKTPDGQLTRRWCGLRFLSLPGPEGKGLLVFLAFSNRGGKTEVNNEAQWEGLGALGLGSVGPSGTRVQEGAQRGWRWRLAREASTGRRRAVTLVTI